MIGRLLGHSKVGTTARYAHLVQDAEKAAAAAPATASALTSRRNTSRRCKGAGGGGAAITGRSPTARWRCLPSSADMVFWDRALTGFGVRVYPTEIA